MFCKCNQGFHPWINSQVQSCKYPHSTHYCFSTSWGLQKFEGWRVAWPSTERWFYSKCWIYFCDVCECVQPSDTWHIPHLDACGTCASQCEACELFFFYIYNFMNFIKEQWSTYIIRNTSHPSLALLAEHSSIDRLQSGFLDIADVIDIPRRECWIFPPGYSERELGFQFWVIYLLYLCLPWSSNLVVAAA